MILTSLSIPSQHLQCDPMVRIPKTSYKSLNYAVYYDHKYYL